MKMRRTASMVSATSLLLLAACLGEDPVNTEPPEQFVWEARNIAPTDGLGESFVADAYMVSTTGVVDTGIRMTEAEIGAHYGWLIREGACGGNGLLLTTDPTAFPAFTIDDEGEGGVAKVVFGFLEGTEQFNVEIYRNPNEGLNLVGCAQMNRVEGLPNF